MSNHDYSSLSEGEIHTIATGYLQELEALSKSSPSYNPYTSLSSNEKEETNVDNLFLTTTTSPSFMFSSSSSSSNNHDSIYPSSDGYALPDDNPNASDDLDTSGISINSTNSTDWLPEYFANLVESARLQWIPLSEASSFLLNGAQKAVDIIYDAVGPVGPPVRPESGSLFIVDERRLSQWRDDGYNYVPMHPDVQQRPLAGIQYRDGNIYGSRQQHTATIHNAASTVSDILTLTFLRNTIHPKDLTSTSLTTTSPSRLYSPTGDFLEQTVILEWSVVNQSEWSTNDNTNNDESNPSTPHLQRRAIRLPRLGSGASVLNNELQSPSQKLSDQNDQGAGYIWLVQYLVDKLPPCYTPNGQPIGSAVAKSSNEQLSPSKENGALTTATTTKAPTRRPPPKPSAIGSNGTAPTDTESVTRDTSESIEFSVSTPDTDLPNTSYEASSLSSSQRREELAKQYADLSAELDAIDYNTMLQARQISDSPVGHRNDDKQVHAEVIYPGLSDIDDTEILAALHAGSNHSDNTIHHHPSIVTVPESKLSYSLMVDKNNIEINNHGIPNVPPVPVLIPPTHTMDSALATVHQYHKDAVQTASVLPILASTHRKPTGSPLNPSSSPPILIASPPRGISNHLKSSPKSPYNNNIPIYDPQIVPAAEQLFPVSTVQYITNANGELVPYHEMSYHPEPQQDPLAVERRRQAAINLHSQRIALAQQLREEDETKLQEQRRRQQLQQQEKESKVKTTLTIGEGEEESLRSETIAHSKDSFLSKPHRLPPPIPTLNNNNNASYLLPSSTEYPSATVDEQERDYGSVQGEEIAQSIEINDNDTVSQTSEPLHVPSNIDMYGIAHYKELIDGNEDQDNNFSTDENVQYQEYRVHPNNENDDANDQSSPVNGYHDEYIRSKGEETEEFDDQQGGYAAMFARSRVHPTEDINDEENNVVVQDNEEDDDKDSSIYAESPSRMTKAVPQSEIGKVPSSHIPGTGSYSLMHAQEIELRRSMLGNPSRNDKATLVHTNKVSGTDDEEEEEMDSNENNDPPVTSYSALHQSQKLRNSTVQLSSYPSVASSKPVAHETSLPIKSRLSSSMVNDQPKSKTSSVRLSQSSIDVYRYSDPQTMHGKRTTEGESNGETDDHLRYPRPVRTKAEAEEQHRSHNVEATRTSRKSRGRHSSRHSRSSREPHRRSSTSRHRRRSSRSSRSPSTESSLSSRSRSSSTTDSRSSEHRGNKRNSHRRTSRDSQRRHSRSSRHRSSSAHNRGNRESSSSHHYSSSQNQRSRTSRDHYHKNRSRTASPETNANYPVMNILNPNAASMVGPTGGQTALVNIGGRLVQVRIPSQNNTVVNNNRMINNSNPSLSVSMINSTVPMNGMNTNNAYQSEVQAILEQQTRLNQLREANTANNLLRMSNIGNNYYRSSAGIHNSFGTLATGGAMRYPVMDQANVPNMHPFVPPNAPYHPGYNGVGTTSTNYPTPPNQISSNYPVTNSSFEPSTQAPSTEPLPKDTKEEEVEIEYGPYGPVRKVKPASSPSQPIIEPSGTTTVDKVDPSVYDTVSEINTVGNEIIPDNGNGNGTVPDEQRVPVVTSPPIKSSYQTKQKLSTVNGIINGISYANIGTGEVTLDSKYGIFTNNRNSSILIAILRGWRTRSLFKLRRIRDMKKRAMDTYHLLQQLITDTNPDKDNSFENGIRTQLAGEINDLLIIVNDNNGERGSIELTNYLQNQLRLRNKNNKTGNHPPETGPLITEADEEADEEAAARGAKRAAERKSRLKGGAVGKAVMAKYSKIPVKEDNGTETNEENMTDTNDTNGGPSVSTAPPEKPWLKARKKGKDDDSASVEDVLVVAAPKRRTTENNSIDGDNTIDNPSTKPTNVPPATTKKRSLLANQDAVPKEEDENTFGNSLAPSGKWRVLIEIIAAKNLAPALYAPGTLAAGPGLKSEPITDPNALAPDPEARESYAVAYLARILPSKTTANKMNNNRGNNHRRGSIPDGGNTDDNNERYKVMGKKMQTNVASKSLAPVYKKRFLFTLPIRAGLPHNGDLPSPPTNEEEEENVRNLCMDLANNGSIENFEQWQVRVDILDSDRYVRDTYMGGSFINLVDMPTEKARTSWFTLQAQSSNDRVRGSVQLRYRFIMPTNELRQQFLMDEIMGTTSATISGGGNNPRVSLIDRFNNDNTNENNNDDDNGNGKGNFLRRKSANLKPQKIDYSHVTAKTVSRGEGMNVPTTSQQRTGGNVRMYKMPDYSKVRSRVAIDAGLAEEEEEDNSYGKMYAKTNAKNSNSNNANNKGRGKSSSRNPSRRGSNDQANTDAYDYDDGALPKGGKGNKQPSTKTNNNPNHRRRDIDEDLLYDDDNQGNGGGYTRYVSYDNDLLREAARVLGEESSLPINNNNKTASKGNRNDNNNNNGRTSLPGSNTVQPPPTGAASRITQEDMKKIFDRGLRSSSIPHTKDTKYKSVNGPTIDPAGAIEYQPEYFQNNPTLWLDHQTMGGKSIVPPESPATFQPKSRDSGSSNNYYTSTEIQPPRRGSISKPVDTSNSKIPRPNSISTGTGIPISYALPIHSTYPSTTTNNNNKGDIMESVGAAIDRFFNTNTNNFSAAANHDTTISPTGTNIPVPLPGSYVSSGLTTASRQRLGTTTRPVETSPTSSSLSFRNTVASSSSGAVPPLAKVSSTSSDIPLSRDFKPVYTSNILSPELKNILFSSRVPSATTSTTTNNNNGSSKGISELTKAAITAVQQGNDPNANAKLTEEVARFAAELRKSMKG